MNILGVLLVATTRGLLTMTDLFPRLETDMGLVWEAGSGGLEFKERLVFGEGDWDVKTVTAVVMGRVEEEVQLVRIWKCFRQEN